jgi:hypothetical protein
VSGQVYFVPTTGAALWQLCCRHLHTSHTSEPSAPACPPSLSFLALLYPARHSPLFSLPLDNLSSFFPFWHIPPPVCACISDSSHNLRPQGAVLVHCNPICGSPIATPKSDVRRLPDHSSHLYPSTTSPPQTRQSVTVIQPWLTNWHLPSHGLRYHSKRTKCHQELHPLLLLLLPPRLPLLFKQHQFPSPPSTLSDPANSTPQWGLNCTLHSQHLRRSLRPQQRNPKRST